jgi:hypothetical protein
MGIPPSSRWSWRIGLTTLIVATGLVLLAVALRGRREYGAGAQSPSPGGDPRDNAARPREDAGNRLSRGAPQVLPVYNVP